MPIQLYSLRIYIVKFFFIIINFLGHRFLTRKIERSTETAGHHTGRATDGLRIAPQTTPKYNKFSLNDGAQVTTPSAERAHGIGTRTPVCSISLAGTRNRTQRQELSPQCRRNASIDGSRPLKALKTSRGSSTPPVSRICCKKARPAAVLKTPSCSNRL